jgi:tRNA-modifying protein YgfZ
MNTQISWNQFVAGRGGHLAAGRVENFGAPREELQAARERAALVPLSHLGVVSVSGADAAHFLHNQLTSDVRQVSKSVAQFSGYCNAKGRLIATFLVALQEEGYRLIAPMELVPVLAGRLKKFVLRAKVVITEENAFPLLGVCGPLAQKTLARVFSSVPRLPLEAVSHPNATLIALPSDTFALLSNAESIAALWASLAAVARPAGTAAWEWRQIRAGIAAVLPATLETFVPQMLGLETYGAVSFDKGCYPGQEIVARTHYRGEVKRRLARGSAPHEIKAGDSLLDEAGETRGTIANAAPSPDGDWEFLAVVQRDSLQAPLKLADGAPVQLAGALLGEGSASAG